MKTSTDLTEHAYQKIKNWIFYQKLVPGQKIHYLGFCQQLHMSKTPIVAALQRLANEGLLTKVANVGYFVKSITKKEIEDLFEAREALEVQCLKTAIDKRTKKGLEVLSETVKAHKNYFTPFYDQRKLVLDAEVHLQIAKMSKNEVMLKLLIQIFEHIYFRHLLTMMNPNRLSISTVEHQNIVEAIKNGNTSEAEKMIRTHIRAAKKNILSTYTMQIDQENINLGQT